MITRIGVAPRRAGLGSEEFQAHWAGPHGDVVPALPGLRRYWQNHALLEEGEPLLPWPGFDACADLDFPSVAAMRDAFASPAYTEAVKADEGAFVDKAKGGLMVTRREIRAGTPDPAAGVRLMRFLRAAPGRAEALAAALRGTPAEPEALAEELLLALSEAEAGPSIFDAVEALWFDSPAGALGWLRSPAARERIAATAGLVRGTEHLLARVRVVV